MTVQVPPPPEKPIAADSCPTLPAEGYQAVLQNPNFLALWIGQIFSQLADRVVFVVFIALIVKYLGTSDRYSSFLYIAFTIPAMLLTAVAGVFIDRWPRRMVLVTTNVLRAIFVASLPLFAKTNPWSIYGLAFLLSAATQFFVPAEAATIPMIVRKDHLMTANSLFTTTMMASVIFGFALGDPLINIFSMHYVHWAIVGLFVLASIALTLVKTPPPALVFHDGSRPKPQTISESIEMFFAEMKEGIAYIKSNQPLLQLMLKLALLFSTVVALCILFISFAKEFLYDNPEVAARKFAYIIAISGIGMAMGSFILGHYLCRAKRGWMVFGGFTTIGVCLLLLAFIGQLIHKSGHVFQTPQITLGFLYLDPINFSIRMLYTYALTFVMGVAAALVAIPLQALIQEIIPADKRGKILGIQFTLLSTCSTLPVLIAGLGVEQIGTQWMFLLMGAPLLLLGLGGLYQRSRQIDAPVTNW